MVIGQQYVSGAVCICKKDSTRCFCDMDVFRLRNCQEVLFQSPHLFGGTHLFEGSCG